MNSPVQSYPSWFQVERTEVQLVLEAIREQSKEVCAHVCTSTVLQWGRLGLHVWPCLPNHVWPCLPNHASCQGARLDDSTARSDAHAVQPVTCGLALLGCPTRVLHSPGPGWLGCR